MQVKTHHGFEPLDESRINDVLQEACEGLPKADWMEIAGRCKISWYDGITTNELAESTIMAAKSLIEVHPDYDFAAARLLLRKIYKEVDANEVYTAGCYINHGIYAGRLDPKVFADVQPIFTDKTRDLLFRYQGVQILYDRYLLRDREGKLIETPQYMWLRVATGIAHGEANVFNKRYYQQKFYDLISQFKYMPSTPTLFNAGTTHPQMASCYVTHVDDSLSDIFKTYGEIAQMSKWAGGIGTNWSSVRGTGANIKGTNGQSTGLIPWLKIQNDIAIAVNQGGKRRGSHCAYLEPWHIDFEEFLDLRKSVGDDRRRTHDLNTACWIPDLFMQRVKTDGYWTYVCPSVDYRLTETWGKEWEYVYESVEEDVRKDKLRGRVVRAKDVWKKILSSLFETGHPWICFKDACNRANPLQSQGLIRSSNLCTEITLNTGPNETAVCNLGSINLSQHLTIENGVLVPDYDELEKTTRLAVRALDNIIDVMFYPTEEAAETNKRNRPIGLGVMGTSSMLEQLEMNFESSAAEWFIGYLHEHISTFANSESANLAEERGAFETHETSTAWDVDGRWLRNSFVTAIAPTATISNICGTSPSIEPNFNNLYVVSNLSGDFTVVNCNLVKELENLGLWDEQMLNDLKAFDGSVQNIDRVPQVVKNRYKIAFEIDQNVLIKLAAMRQPHIHQSQSLNLYVKNPSGKALSDLYMNAWESGLKTTYYLRTEAASNVEKSTVDPNVYGKTIGVAQCKIDDPECESCQ